MVRDMLWHNVSVNIVLLLFSLLARGKYVKAAHCVWFSAVLILLYFWYLNRSQRSHNCHAQQMEHVKLKKCLWGADLALPKDQITVKHLKKKFLLLSPELRMTSVQHVRASVYS